MLQLCRRPAPARAPPFAFPPDRRTLSLVHRGWTAVQLYGTVHVLSGYFPGSRKNASLPRGRCGCRAAAATAALSRRSRCGMASRLPRVNIVWHKCTDLRLHDHEASLLAHTESLPVLHLFILDPVWFRPLPLSGFAKTGKHRCKFLLECLEDLKCSLEAVGQYLCVLRGPTHACFEQLCARYDVATCYAFSEVCSQEKTVERRVDGVLREAGAKLQLLWGFTLYHIDDLRINPYQPHSYRTYSAFRRPAQEQSAVRAEVPAPRTWRPPPVAAASEPGAEPLPSDLGVEFGAGPTPPLDDRAPVEWVGGERAALAWLQDYVWKRQALALKYVGATNTMTRGRSAITRDATTKLSPWLAHGCVSPRRIFHEVERYEKTRRANKATGWLKHELVCYVPSASGCAATPMTHYLHGKAHFHATPCAAENDRRKNLSSHRLPAMT